MMCPAGMPQFSVYNPTVCWIELWGKPPSYHKHSKEQKFGHIHLNEKVCSNFWSVLYVYVDSVKLMHLRRI